MRNINQTNSPPRLLALLFGAALLGLVSQSALALGTLSGTPINNQATLNYTVGTTAQSAINASVGFVVDNKVNLTVAKVADNANTIPNLNNQAVAFTVTNTGNTPQRYALSAVVGASTLTTPLTNVRIYRDNGSTPGVWDATDTLYVDAGSFLDVAPDTGLNVLIVADVPASDLNGENVVYSLLATTVNAGTLAVTTQVGNGSPNTLLGPVDVVFADPMTGIAGDSAVARDGQAADSATYTIATAALTVSKTATVYSDPFTGVSANAKAIPGAVITYTITVANAAGGATATSVSIADSLNAEITSVPAHLAFATQFTDATNACAAGQGVVVAGGGEIAGGVCKTNAVDVQAITNADFTANVVNVSGLSIAGGTTATIKFQVVVQ
jgi:uncharacterized repeat protein (TIGR01451 family)